MPSRRAIRTFDLDTARRRDSIKWRLSIEIPHYALNSHELLILDLG
jgi:hypothetical protein